MTRRRPAQLRCPWIAVCLGALATYFAGGCAAVPLATLGTVAGVAASAVSTGRDVYKGGKLDTAEMAGLDAAAAAARAAGGDLGLRLENETWRKDGTAADLTFADARGGGAVKVHLDRRGDSLVRARIDVGLFGHEATARLFLSRMRRHLPGANGPAPPAEH